MILMDEAVTVKKIATFEQPTRVERVLPSCPD